MYISITSDVLLPIKNLVAVIGCTKREIEKNKINRNFLEASQQRNGLIDICGENRKSIIVADKDIVYLTSVSSKTVIKRCISGFSGGE